MAVVSTALGLVLIAGAGAVAPWRLPRTRFVGVLLIPLLLALVALVTFPVTGSGWTFVTKSHIRAVWPFLALVVLLMIMVATRLRGPRSAAASVLTVLVGFAGFVGYVLGTVASLGICPASMVTGDNLALIGFFAMVGVPVLLIWLGVEGLRLSSNIGAQALTRFSEGTLLSVLLAVKVAVLVTAGLLIMLRRAPGWLAVLSPGRLALAIAVVVVLLIMTLLTREERIIGSGPDDFTTVSRGFALLVAMTLVTIPAYGVIGMLAALPGRPALALALIITVVVAVLAGLLLRRRSPLAGIVVIVVGAVSSYALLLWSYAHSGQFQLPALFASGVTQRRLGLLLGIPLALGLVGVVLLLRRRRYRGHRVFFVALLVWVLVTTALPLLVTSHPGTNAIAVDVVATAAILVLAITIRLGWQQSVSAYELVLLLITTTVVVEGPVLISALPPSWNTPLLIFAFLIPAIAALTVEAGALSDTSDRRERVLTRVGIICLSYGLAGILASTALNPLQFLQQSAGLMNGVSALPFAVVLVAVMSANRSAPGP